MEHAEPVRVEELLEHATWLRSLARSLVGDSSTADDVVQETWLAALRRPPSRRGGLRGWLATIARNVVRMRIRSETARTRRDERHPRLDDEVDPHRLAEKLELQRRLAVLVSQLPEVERTTILLRFYEGRRTSEIAAQCGVPESTVRGRLARGIGRLRKWMDERAGGRSAWAALLVPLGPPAAVGPLAGGSVAGALAKGGLLVSTKGKLATTLGVLIVASFLVWHLAQSTESRHLDDGGERAARVAEARDDEQVDEVEPQVATEVGRVPVRVVDSTRRPVEGALVSAFDARISWDRRALVAAPTPATTLRTDAEGRARFDALAPGRWAFVAAKAGFASAGRADIAVASPLESDEVVLQLGARCALEGRVVALDGTPLPGAVVLARPESAHAGVPSLLMRAEADDEGRYRFAALARGDHLVSVSVGSGAPIPILKVRVPDVASIDLVVPLGGRVVGRVVDEDTRAPLAGATIRFSARINDGWVASEYVSDQRGRFVIAAVPQGSSSVFGVVLDGWIPSFHPWNGTLVPPGRTAELELTMTRGVLVRGRVLGPDGPIAGARVDPAAVEGTGLSRGSVFSDRDGEYAFHVAPGLRFVITARADGYHLEGCPPPAWKIVRGDEPEADRWWVEAPRTGEVVFDIAMEPNADVTGHVVDEDGAPVEAAWVAAAGEERSGTWSAAGGAFSLTVAPVDTRVEVAASKAGWVVVSPGVVTFEADARPDVGASPGVGVRIVMRRATVIRGTVQSTTGEPIRGAWVAVRATAGAGASEQILADANGRFEIAALAATGTLVVEAGADGYATGRSDPVTLDGSDEVASVDVELSPGVRVAGRVVDESSRRPVPGARVIGAAGGAVVALTDAEGRFVLASVKPGRLELRIVREGFADRSVDVAVPLERELEIELAPTRALAGFVRFADGTAAVGVVVKLERGRRQSTIGRTLGDGSFRSEGLAEGRYELRVCAHESGDGANVLETAAGPFDAGDESVVVVVDAGTTMSGVVRDTAGRPLAGARLNARIASGPRVKSGRRATGVVGSDGSFRLFGLRAGQSYDVSVLARVARFHGFTARGLEAGRTDVVIELPASLAITGTIVGRDGTPLPNAPIVLERVRGSEKNARYQQVGGSPTTNARGAFEIRGLEAGDYRVSVEVGGIVEWLLGGERVAAGSEDLRLRMAESSSLEGVVVDEAGDPVANATVFRDSGVNLGVATTDAEGRFRVNGLRPGSKVAISVLKPGFVPAHRFLATVDGSDVSLVVHRSVPTTVRLLDASGRPLVRAAVQIRCGETRYDHVTTTDGDGWFSTSDTFAGTWIIEVVRDRRYEEIGRVQAGSTDVVLRFSE